MAWRFPLAFQIVFAVVAIVLLFGLTESPRWLFTKRRADEAMEVLCLVYEEGPDGKEVEFQARQIREAIEMERQHGSFKFSQIFKRDRVHTGKRILLAWGVQVSLTEFVCCS